MSERIIFVKPVGFLDIQVNDIFKILYDYDKRPYIVLKSKMKIYLTERRMEYYKVLRNFS